jgi:hypothetical protein
MRKVVFRVWPDDKSCIALFPEIPGDSQPNTCMSFMHIGQHGAADYHEVIRSTRPASMDDYKHLKEELERHGYRLKIVQRCTRKDTEKRLATLAN